MNSNVYFRRIGDISHVSMYLLAYPRLTFGNRAVAPLAHGIPELGSVLAPRMNRLDIPPPVSPQIYYSESRAFFHGSPPNGSRRNRTASDRLMRSALFRLSYRAATRTPRDHRELPHKCSPAPGSVAFAIRLCDDRQNLRHNFLDCGFR